MIGFDLVSTFVRHPSSFSESLVTAVSPTEAAKPTDHRLQGRRSRPKSYHPDAPTPTVT